METCGFMDVFLVSDKQSGPTSGWVEVVRSWDGTLFAETNMLEAAGPDRCVRNSGGVAVVDRVRSNSPLTFRDES